MAVSKGRTPRQYGGGDSSALSKDTPPTADAVDAFHLNSDVDLKAESHHHTIGGRPTQASPGDHLHDGGSSALILDGFTITGSRGDGTALLSAIQCLVRLGAKDNSVA